jgi:hypothetical protein
LLAVGEVALPVILLSGVKLLMKTVLRLGTAAMGFDPTTYTPPTFPCLRAHASTIHWKSGRLRFPVPIGGTHFGAADELRHLRCVG